MKHDESHDPRTYINNVPQEREINFLDLFLILFKYRKMVLLSCLVSFFLAAGITLLLPKIYSATTHILPSKDEKARFFGVLNNRAVADSIIEKFGLMDVYGQRYRSRIYRDLNNHVRITDKNGIIQINVEDSDPRRAAEMANTYVVELKRVIQEGYVNEAKRTLENIENQLNAIHAEFEQAKNKFIEFQTKNKNLLVNIQTKTIIETIAGLNDTPSENELGMAVVDNVQASDGASVQELSLEYALLLRDVRIQATRLESFSQQYERVKIEMAQNEPDIEILDAAFVPDKKIKPRRSLIVLLSTTVVGFLAVLAAFAFEYANYLKNENPERWEAIRNFLRLYPSASKRHEAKIH